MSDDTPRPYPVDDPTVIRLGKFLEKAPLSNGQMAPIPHPLSQLVAQAICNWTAGFVWSQENGDYIASGDWEKVPDLGDVQVEVIGGGPVTRLTHRVTGISALGETADDAWKQLREKVIANAG